MGRKFDHNIRRHFEDVEKGEAVYNRARCNYCHKDIAATASTLQRHLNSCRPYKETAGAISQIQPSATPTGPSSFPAPERSTPQAKSTAPGPVRNVRPNGTHLNHGPERRQAPARKSVGSIRSPALPAPVRRACSLCNADHLADDCWYRANDNRDGTTCEYGSTKYYDNEEKYWLKQHVRLQIEASNALERAIAARKKASTGDADLQRRMNDGRDQVNQAVSFNWTGQEYPIPTPMANMGEPA